MSDPALLRTSSATVSVCQIQSHPTPATQITQITHLPAISSQGGKLCGRRPVRLSGREASRATADTPTTCSVLASRCSAERLSCFDFFFSLNFENEGILELVCFHMFSSFSDQIQHCFFTGMAFGTNVVIQWSEKVDPMRTALFSRKSFYLGWSICDVRL